MGRGSADYWHTLIETKKLVYEDRARYYADPAFAKVPVSDLLSKEYARSRAKQIDPSHAADRYAPGLGGSDTTYLATADADGNMVSLIQSNYQACGSGYVPDGLGFCLQDRGAQFNLKAGTPNALEPSKRPFHTIIPAFATVKGKPWLAFGVMGGDFQPQGHVQILTNLLDFGMNLQEAGDAPRFRHIGSTEPSLPQTAMSGGGTVFFEPGISPDIRQKLESRGHHLGSGTTSYGGYQAVARDPETGMLSGATESRKDGCALGL
jgi:gamma-glutamyltranspeptidase/glutathione hydrolase